MTPKKPQSKKTNKSAYPNYSELATTRNYVWTRSGKRIYLHNPKPEDFCIEDIAGGLSKVCRYNAQTSQFWSVASHSIIVSRYCPDELKLVGLLHDASEAYIHDLSRPIKYLMKDVYEEIEHNFMKAIAKQFNFIWNTKTKSQIKKIEPQIELAEIRDFINLPPDEVVDLTNALECNLYEYIKAPPDIEEDFINEYICIIKNYPPIPF